MAARFLTAAAAALLLVAPAVAGADVQLTIQSGKVSLAAEDATLQEILAEWSRVGGTRIINAERVSGGRLTLQFEDMSESQALGILLRSVNGYVAAPRATPGTGASRFDRIMIMPGTPRPRVASMSPAPFTPPPPPVEQPVFQQAPDDPDADQDPTGRPVRTVPAPSSRGAVFGAFPRPQTDPVAVPAATPRNRTPAPTSPAQSVSPAGTPAGVSVPGMIVPAPAPTDQDPDARIR